MTVFCLPNAMALTLPLLTPQLAALAVLALTLTVLTPTLAPLAVYSQIKRGS